MTEDYTKSLKADLQDTKEADKKKIIFDVIKRWLIEINKDGSNFEEVFLSNKLDKQFEEIKNAIGDFAGIRKMSCLIFLSKIILGDNQDAFFFGLHEEYKRIREEFYKDKKKR
jgi:acetyltransferase-like isoleucine patch superfamily enzyme